MLLHLPLTMWNHSLRYFFPWMILVSMHSFFTAAWKVTFTRSPLSRQQHPFACLTKREIKHSRSFIWFPNSPPSDLVNSHEVIIPEKLIWGTSGTALAEDGGAKCLFCVFGWLSRGNPFSILTRGSGKSKTSSQVMISVCCGCHLSQILFLPLGTWKW